jgi:cardiolipin synthase
LIRSLPNLISLARLLLVPFILRAVWRHDYEWALAWCWVAGLSDFLDGYLARRFGAESRIGAYLDPLGDKFLLSGIFLTFGLGGITPWWLTAMVFARDALILLYAACAMLFTRIRSFPPTVWGKTSTTIQILTALVLLLARTRFLTGPARSLEWPLIVLTVLATGWSAIHYAWVGLRLLRADAALYSPVRSGDNGSRSG